MIYIIKRIFSSIAIFILLFTISMSEGETFATNNNENYQGFIDETKELLAFEPEQLIETNSANDDGNKDNKDFSACRLIVKSNKYSKCVFRSPGAPF